MRDQPLQLALRELQRLVTSPPVLGGMALAILVLTVAGPFGTFADLDLPVRFAYWTLVVTATYLIGRSAITFAGEALRPLVPAFWPRLLLAALLASLPIGAIVIGNSVLFYGFLSLELALRQLFYAAVVTLALTVILGVVGRQRESTSATAAAPMAPVPPGTVDDGVPAARMPAILSRVPPAQRGKLLALIVEDHYVDIVTERGKTLVLMRLADAIREAEPVEGLQIHRSHWVAIAAVARAVRRDGKLFLELTNGLRLPVSRGAQPAVKAAGLDVAR